jgi:predicted MFS family arabinose efflux permease
MFGKRYSAGMKNADTLAGAGMTGVAADDEGRKALALALSGLAALAIAMGIGRFAFTPLLPMMQAEGALDVAQGGILAAANYLGYLVGAVCAAWVGMRPERLIRGSLVAICLTTLAMGVLRDFTSWMVLRFAAGAASAFVLIHVSAWSLERLAALNLSRRAGVVFAGVGTGIACAGLLCLAAMRIDIGAAWSWIGLGIAATLVLAAIWRSFATRNDGHRPVPQTKTQSTWRPSHWLWVFCYGVFGLGYIVPATFLPAMARDALPDPALFGWVWPVFGIAAAVSTLLAARLVASWGARRLWAASHLVMAAGVAAPLVAGGLGGALISALLVGGTFMVATMAGMQHARAVAGAQATRLIASMTAAFATGQVAGPLIVAALKQLPDGGIALALSASSALLAASAIVLLFARVETPNSPASS